MVRLSTKSRYATRLLLDMCRHRHKGPVQLRDIAQRQELPAKYLEQIVIVLKRAGIIKSLRGPKGGHVLMRDPREITVGQIVALLEGGKELVFCDTQPERCTRSEDCVMRVVWQEAARAMFEKLYAYSFQDLLEMEESIRPRVVQA